MDGADNLYSVFVSWAKILLPLAAIALLSSLFMISGRDGDTSDIPFAEIEALARDQALSAPRFAGVADDGSRIVLQAEIARPQNDGLSITGLSAQIDTQDDVHIELNATDGRIEDNGRTARLTGLARVTTSNGYAMETNGLVASMDTGRIETTGRLAARAPFGELTAGSLLIHTPDGAEAQQMVFNDGVTLIYRPQQ